MSARLKLGLWLRMAVSLLLTVVSVGILLAAEFALAAVVSVFGFFLMQTFGVAVLAFAGVAAVCLLSWVGVVAGLGRVTTAGFLAGRIDSDPVRKAVKQVGHAVWEPPSLRKIGRGVGLLAAPGVVLILCYQLGFVVLGLDPIRFGIASGAVIVVGYTGWLVYDERRSAGSVRTQLEDEYDLVSDPQREQALAGRIQRLATQSDCAVPAVEIGASRLPQAATVGYRPRNSVILVSQGLLDALDDEEIEAVLAHELAHLLNRDAAVLTALSFPRSKVQGLVDLVYRWEHTDAEILLIPLFVVATPIYVVNRLAVPAVARYREYVADQAAGEITGNPAAMASALSTLDREYAVRSSRDLRVQWSTAAFGIVPPPWEERKFFDRSTRFLYRRLLGTHPSTEERIERLRAQIG